MLCLKKSESREDASMGGEVGDEVREVKGGGLWTLVWIWDFILS